MQTTRRGFLQLLGVVAAGAYVEPERLVTVFDMAAKQSLQPKPRTSRGWSPVQQWFAEGNGMGNRAAVQQMERIRRDSRSWGYLINADA